MKTGIKVMNAMTRTPISTTPNKTIVDCTHLMLDKKVGSLLIKEGETLLGILTERDLVEMISLGINPKTTQVNQIMSKEITTISPEKDIHDAISLMNEKNLRRLPVLLNNRIIGLITLRDILTLQPALFELILDRVNIDKYQRM